jgi:N-acetylglucosaminyldiphosphoundecaprenol N-acetyl-beta-D-mannosaminyltransferase
MTTRSNGHAPVELMGLRIDPVSEEQAIDAALDGIRRGEGGWICPTNLDVLRQYASSQDVRELVDGADLVVADGMPLLWASRLAGEELPERVAGSSLIWTLPERAARHGATVFLLGGDEGAADEAGRRLQARYPGLRVVGAFCPARSFERRPEELALIEGILRQLRPDFVFVGLGFPKQERLIRRLRGVLPASWFVSCGVSLSFVSGDVQRAPRWLQRLGLEWLHRLVQEPRRLFRRYVVDGFPFLARLLASALRQRVRRTA